MNCQRFNMYVFDYCEDNLSPALKEQMDKHLQGCSYCSSQVNLTYLENEVLRDKSDVPILADDFADKVMQHIMLMEPVLASNSKGNKQPVSRKARGLTLAAAVGLVVLLAIFAPKMLPFHQSAQISDNAQVGSGQHMDNSSAYEKQTRSQAKYGNESADNNQQATQPMLESAVNQNDEMPPVQAADGSLDSAAPAEELPNDESVNIPMSATIDTQLYDTGPIEAKSKSTKSADFMDLKPSNDLQNPSRFGIDKVLSDKVNGFTNSPAPLQVPGDYTLINTVNSYSTEGSAVEYHYTDRTNQSLIITLKNLNDQERVVLMNQEPASSEIIYGTAGSAAKEDLEMIYHVDVNEQSYLVTLEGSLSAEDLVNLAEVITFTDSSASSSSR